jgi:hypothetical protein
MTFDQLYTKDFILQEMTNKPEKIDYVKLKKSLINNPNLELSVRNGIVIPNYKEHLFSVSHKANQLLIELFPKNTLHIKDALKIAIRSKNLEQATKLCCNYYDKFNNLNELASVSKFFVTAKAYLQLHELSIKKTYIFEQESELLYLCILAAHRSGNSNWLKNTVTSFFKLEMLKEQPYSRYISVSLQCIQSSGLHELTRNLIIKYSLNELDSDDVRLEVIRFSINENIDAELELGDVEQTLRKLNTNESFKLLFRYYIKINKPLMADVVYRKLAKKEISLSFTFDLAKAFHSSGHFEQAHELIKPHIEQNNVNTSLQKFYVTLLHDMGNNNEAFAAYNKWVGYRNQKLPDTFEYGLDNLDKYKNKNIPEQRINWILNILENQKIRIKNVEKFKEDLNSTNKLDHFLLDWLECKPERAKEVFNLFTGVTSASLKILNSLKKGNGAFIASAHIGVLFGGPVSLFLGEIPSVWVASIPNLTGGAFNDKLISTVSNKPTQVSRKIISNIRNNKVVTIAVDGNIGELGKTIELFGTKITVSDYIPKLSFKTNTPSFFPSLVYDGKKVNVSVKELPLANFGETSDEYCNRWLNAFVNELTNFFLESPTSLRATGGFWTRMKF